MMGACKSAMPNDKERFEATDLFEHAERLGLANRDFITKDELTIVYASWVNVLEEMGLKRDAQLVAERALRNLG
jgi:hypothetical protein